jgi:hypothetical protein
MRFIRPGGPLTTGPGRNLLRFMWNGASTSLFLTHIAKTHNAWKWLFVLTILAPALVAVFVAGL